MNTIVLKDLLMKETIKLLNKRFVFVPWANRKYEGELKKQGDTVTVQTFPRLSGTDGGIAGDDIPEENFTISAEDLVVDQTKQFNIPVKDIESVQSNLDLRSNIAREIAYETSDTYDQFIASFYNNSNIPTANKINNGSAVTLTKSNVYAQIELMRVALSNQNAFQDAALFVDPSTASLLRQAPEFDGFREGLDVRQRGYVGRMSGFTIYETNNYPTDGSSKWLMAFDRDSIHFVEQMNKMKIEDQPKAFRSNILAEFVYGGKVFEENGKRIATNEVAV